MSIQTREGRIGQRTSSRTLRADGNGLDVIETLRWAFPCNWGTKFTPALPGTARQGRCAPGASVIHPCSSAGLVIEVDGDVHDLGKEEDERREKALSEMGLRIVRFENDEVVRDLSHGDASQSAVVGKIKEAVEK